MPENEKLVLKRYILGLGRVMNRDVARVLEQIKKKKKKNRERERDYTMCYREICFIFHQNEL